MYHLVFFLFLFWVSFCFAKVEIAIEGPHGWAEKLPTWRTSGHNWASLLFFSGRPLTGYHIWMTTFILSVLHLIYIFIIPTWAMELQIIAFFCYFSVLEDFLWFLLNPAFGLRNFRADKIWWHEKSWLWIAPRDYYVMSVLGTVLYLFSLSI